MWQENFQVISVFLREDRHSLLPRKSAGNGMEDTEKFSTMMVLDIFNTEKSKIDWDGRFLSLFSNAVHCMNIPRLYLVQNNFYFFKKIRTQYKIAFQNSGKSIIQIATLYQVKINTCITNTAISEPFSLLKSILG